MLKNCKKVCLSLGNPIHFKGKMAQLNQEPSSNLDCLETAVASSKLQVCTCTVMRVTSDLIGSQ